MSIERDTTKSIPGSTGRSSEPVSGSAMASGRETEFAKRAADAVGDDVTEGRGKNRLDGRGAGAPNDAGTSTSTSNRTNKGQWRAAQLLLLFTILYVSVNLRAPLVGVGPVIDSIRVGLGLSGTELGVLFTLPVLCFGVFAPFAPRLLRLLPPEPLIFYSLIALTLGIALRSVLGSFGLFVGTFLLGLAISRCCTATRRRPDSRGV